MDNNNIKRFGYEDTDKKIEVEIYGLRFEIKNLDSSNAEKYENMDKNLDTVEKEIENILGEGSVKKINDKRLSDGYPKMDLTVELAVLGCVFEAYANSVTGNLFNKVDESINNFKNKYNNLGGNREQRRSTNRYNSRYNRYNKYRRY